MMACHLLFLWLLVTTTAMPDPRVAAMRFLPRDQTPARINATNCLSNAAGSITANITVPHLAYLVSSSYGGPSASLRNMSNIATTLLPQSDPVETNLGLQNFGTTQAIIVLSSTTTLNSTSTASYPPESSTTSTVNIIKARADSPSGAGEASSTNLAIASGSSTAPSPAPSFLKALTNNTCQNAQLTNGSTAWNQSNGNGALDQFIDMYTNNKLFCDECFGQELSTCASTNSSCKNGLRDIATDRQVAGQPRIDVAIGYWARWSTSGKIRCGINPAECVLSGCSDVADSAAAWVVVDSLLTVGNLLDYSWNHLKAAAEHVNADSTTWQKAFVPKTDPQSKVSNRIEIAIFSTFLSGLIGFLPGNIGKITKDLGTAVAISAGNAAWPAEQKGEAPDLANITEVIGNATINGIVTVADALIHNGSVGTGDEEISLFDIIRDGKALDFPNPENWDNTLESTYRRMLYQQLVVEGWTNLQTDGLKHVPMIVYAEGSCDDLMSQPKSQDEHFVPLAVGDKLREMDSHLDYNGSCWWLTNALPAEIPNSEEDGSTYTCQRYESLSGGTNKALEDAGDSFGGLSIADFIVPSIEGWKANNYHNGFAKVSGADGALEPDPRAPGVLNIIVCDYMSDPQRPGVGCPKIDEDHIGIYTCNFYDIYGDASSDLVVFPNNGIYAPGTCTLKISMYDIFKNGQTDINNNPYGGYYQVKVRVTDTEQKVIGGGAKAVMPDLLQVWNTFLPFDILIHGPTKLDGTAVLAGWPFEVWYADQHFVTNDPNHCTGGWGWWGEWNIIDEIHCPFDCGGFSEGDKPKPSATIAHPIPAGATPQPVIPFGPSAVNTCSPSIKPPPVPSSNPQLYKDSHSGDCMIQVLQWEEGFNGVPTWYQFEVNLWKSNSNNLNNYDELVPLAPFANALVPAPPDRLMPIYGLERDVQIEFPSNKDEWYHIWVQKDDRTWDIFDGGVDNKDHHCEPGDWAQGHRGSRCHFHCGTDKF